VTALIVAALHAEAHHVPDSLEVLVTGVGKARAAAVLAHRLATGPRPSLVVNIGTAGAVRADAPTGPVEIGYVTQHDFPHDAIALLVGQQLPRGFALSAQAPPAPTQSVPQGVSALATGDVFVADPVVAARIAAAGIDLVDMEAFAYAAVCAEFGIPLRCAKVVSDAADDSAAVSWLGAIDGCARALGEWLTRNVPVAG
jgi:adenosylhomocysteine nucleosidase